MANVSGFEAEHPFLKYRNCRKHIVSLQENSDLRVSMLENQELVICNNAAECPCQRHIGVQFVITDGVSMAEPEQGNFAFYKGELLPSLDMSFTFLNGWFVLLINNPVGRTYYLNDWTWMSHFMA